MMDIKAKQEKELKEEELKKKLLEKKKEKTKKTKEEEMKKKVVELYVAKCTARINDLLKTHGLQLEDLFNLMDPDLEGSLKIDKLIRCFMGMNLADKVDDVVDFVDALAGKEADFLTKEQFVHGVKAINYKIGALKPGQDPSECNTVGHQKLRNYFREMYKQIDK